MDGLAQDLSVALEESSTARRPKGKLGRRRVRSTGNLPLACVGDLSDQSSSSIDDTLISCELGMSSLHQSDSDDGSPTPHSNSKGRLPLHSMIPKSRRNLVGHHINCIESDSVNETFSPCHPNTKRKRKFKRMAVDPDQLPSTSHRFAHPTTIRPWVPSFSHRTTSHRNSQPHLSFLLCGKRKRSLREKRGTSVNTAIKFQHNKSSRNYLTANSCEKMECGDGNSDHESSLSSSESDPGLLTNDEGREADDEQSDWVYECSNNPSNTWKPLSLTDDEKLSTSRGRCISTALTGREIRSGRRRLDNDPLNKRNKKTPLNRFPATSPFLNDPVLSKLGACAIDTFHMEHPGFSQQTDKHSNLIFPKSRLHLRRSCANKSVNSISEYKRRRRCSSAAMKLSSMLDK